MVPILIKKDPHKYENLPYNKEDFQSVINEVNPSDILDYIVNTITDKWAPHCYWKYSSIDDKMFIGELYWIIYSYLVHNKLLIIENRYFGYNPWPALTYKIERSISSLYLDRCSYHNSLETDLYKPILNRMIDEKYLISSQDFYTLGPLYWRNINLENILK